MENSEKIKALTDLLNECLESSRQEQSFTVIGIVDDKLRVDFNIVEIPEDDYIGFQGY